MLTKATYSSPDIEVSQAGNLSCIINVDFGEALQKYGSMAMFFVSVDDHIIDTEYRELAAEFSLDAEYVFNNEDVQNVHYLKYVNFVPCIEEFGCRNIEHEPDPFGDESGLLLITGNNTCEDACKNYTVHEYIEGYADGIYNQAIDLGSVKNTNRYLKIYNLELFEGMTFSMWFNLPDGASSDVEYFTFFSLADYFKVKHLALQYIPSSEMIRIFVNGTAYSGKVGSIPEGEWHFISLVIDNTVATVFINNSRFEIPIKQMSLNYSKNNVFIVAQEQDRVGGYFDENQCLFGKIDQIRIFKKPLSCDRIAMIREEKIKY
jgi:hypothetical protein